MGVIRYALNHTKKTFFDLDKFTDLDTADLPLTEDSLKLIFEDFGSDEDYKAEVIDNLLKFEAEEIITDCNDEVPDDYVSAGGIYDEDNEYIGLTWDEIISRLFKRKNNV